MVNGKMGQERIRFPLTTELLIDPTASVLRRLSQLVTSLASASSLEMPVPSQDVLGCSTDMSRCTHRCRSLVPTQLLEVPAKLPSTFRESTLTCVISP